MSEQRSQYRRKEDQLFLPTEDQERQIDHVMSMTPEERERLQILMHLDTRERLFGHMSHEEPKVVEMYAAIFGNEEKKTKGIQEQVASLVKTDERLNIWLDGVCFMIKHVLPWGGALLIGAVTLAKHMGWL